MEQLNLHFTSTGCVEGKAGGHGKRREYEWKGVERKRRCWLMWAEEDGSEGHWTERPLLAVVSSLSPSLLSSFLQTCPLPRAQRRRQPVTMRLLPWQRRPHQRPTKSRCLPAPSSSARCVDVCVCVLRGWRREGRGGSAGSGCAGGVGEWREFETMRGVG